MKFRYIDLFAGIGGFRVALDSVGGTCVFSAEIDNHACMVYEENFGINPYCDITKLDAKLIPDFDVLCAGFPCQSFSICGQKKGFLDATRGTLFFDIVRILKEKKPAAFILENVKNLVKHDGGNTISIITQTLLDLGYSVDYKILNAKDFGVPQNRERVFIVGNKKGISFDFNLIKTNPCESMEEFLDSDSSDFEFLQPDEYTLLPDNLVTKNKNSGLMFVGYRNKPIRKKGVKPNTMHLSRVHKQPNRIYSAYGTHPTLASGESSGRYWIYNDGKVRKLTMNECFRFFGFPEDFKKPGSISELYKRIGNSVCIPVVESIATEVINQIFTPDENEYTPRQLLEDVYNTSIKIANNSMKPEFNLSKQQESYTKELVSFEETQKAVFTVTVSSLTYKILHPKQDIRYHQVAMPGGYSGRTFDTDYVTPFLLDKGFLGAMRSGSGWLTRSLEQPHPFTLDFPGKIQNKRVKEAFLQILNDVEINNANPQIYLEDIFARSIVVKRQKMVNIVNPVDRESNIPIRKIINLLHQHFYTRYSSRGASVLPVIAIYSIYQCLVKNLERFDGMLLDPLSSHYSSDRSSGKAGDISVVNSAGNTYEAVEVKFDIAPTLRMIETAYEKIKDSPCIQRYYILSTIEQNDESIVLSIDDRIDEIYKSHGCQFIVNGVFTTLKYYLRLMKNTDDFIETYTKNLQENTEIDAEHKVAWNRIYENYSD